LAKAQLFHEIVTRMLI